MLYFNMKFPILSEGRINTEEGLLLKSMQKLLKNWKWSGKEDLNLYSISDIIEKIKTTHKVNKNREIYYVPGKYLDFD